jgi:flagellar M-ring protein FliF
MAAGLMASLCILLVSIYLIYLRPDYSVLFSKLRASDAAAIVSELERRKTPYRLSDNGTTISVPSNIMDATRLSVVSEDLPIKGMTGFELFNKSDMGLTEFAQKINFMRALQGELARTIMGLEGIDSARVHLSLTEPTIFKADRIPPKASVTVITRPGTSLSSATVRGIQRLVASSVPDLDIANVAVLDGQGEVVSGEPPLQSTPASPLEQKKRAIESLEAATIEEALERSYPGSSIGVTVQMDMAASPAEQENADEDSAASIGTPRTHRLTITLSPQTLLSEEASKDVRAIVANAIGFDPALGDVIMFGPRPTSVAQRLPENRPSPPGLRTELPQGQPEVVKIGAPLDIAMWTAAVSFAAIVLLLWRRSMKLDRRHRRQIYVDRLNALLDQGDDDVVERG